MTSVHVHSPTGEYGHVCGVEARSILSGGQESINEFMVVTLLELRVATVDLPEKRRIAIQEAILEHEKRTEYQQRITHKEKRNIVLWAVGVMVPIAMFLITIMDLVVW
jgi:hypothetical protein